MLSITDSEKLFAKVEQLRMNKNWSTYELAKRTGASSTSFRSWQERKTLPSLTLLSNICEAFEINIVEFLEAEEEYSELIGETEDLVSTINSLTKEQKKALKAFIKTMKYSL